MAVRQKHPNAPWLYDHASNDLVGVKDPDGSEFLWARAAHYGSWFNDSDQAAIAANTAKAIDFNNTIVEKGIELRNSNELHFARAGFFNFTLTAQLVNIDSQIGRFFLWGMKNGTDIPVTTTRVSVTESHGGSPGGKVLERTYFAPMAAGDYIQIMFEVDDVQTFLGAETATASRPAGPSAALAIYEVAY